jgi:peptidoglycan L-alanyl-D-glutamate endopeptidase CwlK
MSEFLDDISEQRLLQVMPALGDRVRQMAAILAQEGIRIRVVQGLRTVEEQDALYAQGRTSPGKVVTNCAGGRSYHNFGLAVDCVPSINGFNMEYAPDWDGQHPAWKRMEAVGQSLGLDSGAMWRSFPDMPHFQFTGRFPEGEPSDEVRKLFAAGGLQRVWAEVTP